MNDISFIIPAYNEEERIGKTLETIKKYFPSAEVIVIDDGSRDKTKEIAEMYADTVFSSSINRGKGYAMQQGWRLATRTYIACLDADLEESAKDVFSLIQPLQQGRADVTISIIKPGRQAGMGFVKRRVQSIVLRETGVKLQAPLSGQRVFHRKWLKVLLKKAYHGFGIETQMTIDLLQAGAKCLEIPTTMQHREMGKDMKGFVHRIRQWADIKKQLRGAKP
ncbi:glycosyltransferase family 2 protein [Halalkalibacter kiskunsagensis]|uniref:Glycosyltransferase family 2 protein n=1 Tax=Halalkalibacter kiskunsagensis TaxID=1548599 RepID=A0ABV6KCH9_9BACI